MKYSAGASKTVVFITSADVTKGQAVEISGATTQANPVPSLDVSRNVPTVAPCTLSDPTGFVGIALEDTDSGDSCNVCVEGVCQGFFNASENIATGDRLSIAASKGELGECGTTTAQSVAIALEADASTSEGTLLDVYISPHIVGIGF